MTNDNVENKVECGFKDEARVVASSIHISRVHYVATDYANIATERLK